MRGDAGAQLRARHPVVVGDLARVRRHRAVVGAEKQMHDLVLDQAVADVGAVMRAQHELQLAIDAEFLAQAPPRRVRDRLAGPRMRAAGVGPQAARVIFAGSAPLQQHPPSPSSTQTEIARWRKPLRVRFDLGREAGLAILVVDQDDGFVAVDHGAQLPTLFAGL